MMKKIILFFIALTYSSLLYSSEYECNDSQTKLIQVNPKTSVKVQNLYGVCSFVVETSKDSRKFSYSEKEYEAVRSWSFQSTGKVLIHSHYQTAPTDSSANAYKAYQMYPNNEDLKLITNEDESFSIRLANGLLVHFNSDGSIDKNKTVDLKIKDTPISVPNIPKDKSSSKYEELNHLSYRDSKKSAIRVYHRQINASATSRSIGLETKKGMYIPLGIEMGKIPGNSPNAKYTLFGIDDERLCSEKMPAHYFFNYQVRCSAKSPNKRCACKHSESEAQSLFTKNSQYEKEIRKLKREIQKADANELAPLQKKLSEREKVYRPKLYSEIYFTCSLDKDSAMAFIAGKKISGDNREIEGVSVKDTESVLSGLIGSNKCRKLKRAYHDCVECFEKDILKMNNIENQEIIIQEVLEQI
ncbi:hypothetical protein [Halobacteriovorax sp.]|uniref:hypothetical protein n=1 Tax=Halobacteriovorax sp. TaxID=2020862 RepID=UPI0035629920